MGARRCRRGEGVSAWRGCRGFEDRSRSGRVLRGLRAPTPQPSSPRHPQLPAVSPVAPVARRGPGRPPRLGPPGGLLPGHPGARADRVPARPPPPRQAAAQGPAPRRPRTSICQRHTSGPAPSPAAAGHHSRCRRTYERDHSGSGSAAPDGGALWAAPQGMVGGALDQLSGAVTANASPTPASPGVVRAERVRTSSGQRAVRARRCATLP
jgi:hypothetical protein